jgi:hypothetical protein
MINKFTVNLKDAAHTNASTSTGTCKGLCRLTPTDVDLIQGVSRRGKHPHVRSELLSQRLDDVLCGGRARHTDALGRKVPCHAVLEVEAHHTVELQVLKGKDTGGALLIVDIMFYSIYNLDRRQATVSVPIDWNVTVCTHTAVYMELKCACAHTAVYMVLKSACACCV